ncbi:MAG: biopolymer transporter ExbD [Candidatus Omnitrophica bacterium]|jgi:biopolymer transport protein ExbD|nr:biopolymer transporter ExbD [Candidatus Omnitrophota bacterium]
MKEENFFDVEQKENALSRINIVNFVDVALTLVIILLMISPIVEQGMEVKLPVSSVSKMAIEKSIVITIGKQGKIFLANQEMDIQRLQDFVRTKILQDPDTSVVIKGDRAITYQELVNVLDVLKRADVKKIGLATEAKVAK